MALSFADTHNMIAYLTKSDASEGFNQIIDFLNASLIQYALTVNPNIYVSCIKQFWSSISIKKVNDVVRLQALIDRKKVIITEATVREALRLDDAESIDCLPNEEIFIELSRMGCEKPSTKLTFYKAFFSAQCRKFIFSKYIFDSLVRNMDSSSKFYMVGKGFSGEEIPLFKDMLVPQQDAIDIDDVVADSVPIDDVDADVPAATAEPTLPSPPPTTTTRTTFHITNTIMDDQEDASKQGGIIAKIDANEDVILEEVDTEKDAKVVEKDADVQGRLEESQAKVDQEETATPSTIIHSDPKSKDKGKQIMVEEPKPLKKQAQIKQDEAYARELEAELNKNINLDDVIEQVKEKGKQDNDKYCNSNVAFLEKSKEELEEEESRALKRKTESSEVKAVKKQELDAQVEEIKKHLQIVPNDDDDVYTEVTPLALKVPVVDYEIYSENNKPFYKIIRADRSHQLFLSFLSLLRNFDTEDLEVLWQIVKETFASSKPKNFSDDFLLTTLTYMFEKPDVEAQV
nr:xylulose kinase-1 [Tanacetum cinerariifolium]